MRLSTLILCLEIALLPGRSGMAQEVTTVENVGGSPNMLQIPTDAKLGKDTVALQIIYELQQPEANVPTAVDVYLVSGDSDQGGVPERALVNKLVGFSPPDPDGTRRATIQLSEESREFLASRHGSVAVQIGVDQLSAMARSTAVRLQEVKVINER